MGRLALFALATLLGAAPALAEPASPARSSQTDEARALELYERGAYRDAARLLAQAVLRRPDDVALNVRLAYAYQGAGESQRSAIAAEAASSLDPRPIESWRERLKSSLGRSRPHETLVAAVELARLRPSDCAVLLLAAAIEETAARPEPAAALFRRAEAACPDDPAVLAAHARSLLAAGCDADAVTRLARAHALRPDDPAIAALLSAARREVARRLAGIDAELRTLEAAVDAGLLVEWKRKEDGTDERFRDALQRLERLAHEAPDDPEVALRRGELWRIGAELAIDGAHDRAREAARRALDLRPGWTRALLLLGSVELASVPPDPVAAERAFVEALRGAEGDAQRSAWSGLFLALLAQDRRDAAVDAADRYLALVPGDAEMRALRDRARSATSE